MNSNEIHQIAQIREMLRQAGLQSTAVRLAVLRLLLHTNSPMPCTQIANAIIPLGFQRSAFPKVLRRLVEVGLVEQFKNKSMITQFRVIGTSPYHSTFERNEVAIAGVA